MNRRAHVVPKARQREFRGSCPPTNFVVSFEHEDGRPTLRQRNRGAQAIGTRADHDRIKRLPVPAHRPNIIPPGN